MNDFKEQLHYLRTKGKVSLSNTSDGKYQAKLVRIDENLTIQMASYKDYTVELAVKSLYSKVTKLLTLLE